MPALVTDELWEAVAPHLPAHSLLAEGRATPRGRPPGPGRHPVRPAGGAAVAVSADRDGVRVGQSTCWRRFEEWTAAGVWDRAHEHLLAASAGGGC